MISILNKIANEGFQNANNTGNAGNAGNAGNTKSGNTGQLMILLVMVVLWLCLVLLVGKYLWNECLCKAVSVCKPIDSVFVLLGIIVLFDVLHPQM